MFFYLSIFIINFLAIVFITDIKAKKIITLFLMFVLALSVGIRFDVGADFHGYYEVYKNLGNLNSVKDLLLVREEFGFVLLGYFLFNLGFEEPYFFFFLISVMTFYFMNKAIINFKLDSYCLVILLTYFCFFFFNFQYNTIRHGLMVSIVWYAFSFIIEKRIKYFLLFIILASMFHQLAFAFIPFYWLLRIKQNTFFSVLLLMSFVLVVIGKDFFSDVFLFLVSKIPIESIKRTIDFYVLTFNDQLGVRQNVTLGTIVYVSFYFVVFFNKEKLKNIRGFDVLMNALYFGLLLNLLFINLGVFSQRISSLLYLSLAFLIAILIRNLFSSKKLLVIMYSVYLLYVIFIFRANVFKMDEYNNYQFIPYQTFLDSQ